MNIRQEIQAVTFWLRIILLALAGLAVLV